MHEDVNAGPANTRMVCCNLTHRTRCTPQRYSPYPHQLAHMTVMVMRILDQPTCTPRLHACATATVMCILERSASTMPTCTPRLHACATAMVTCTFERPACTMPTCTPRLHACTARGDSTSSWKSSHSRCRNYMDCTRCMQYAICAMWKHVCMHA
eukprot:365682-Chlamydomonas_euryale.AAC.11